MTLARPLRLCGLFLLFVLLPLGLRALWIPDESRYAEIAREMLTSGNWIVPQQLGMHYFEKPVAGYWFTALSQMLFGQNLFASRLPVALATALSALLVGLLAQRLWQDRRKSAIAALLYLSGLLVASMGMYITLDPQLALWLNLALLAFYCAVTTAVPRRRLAAWVLVGAACGMAFLTKGFVAWLLPVLVAGPYMLWQRRLGELLRFGPIAVLVALLVAAPWALAVHLQAPDYWNFFFWNEHIRRFAAEDAQHGEPLWFYLPVLLIGCLPWSGLLPPALRRAWADKRDPRIGFLLIWLLLPLAFFSVSRGKLPTYMLPCLTPLALLLAHGLVDQLERGRRGWFKAHAAINLCLGLIGLVGVLVGMNTGIYGPGDQWAWALALGIGVVWSGVALMQLRQPLRRWEWSALPLWLLLACLPGLLTQNQIDSKMPTQFIKAHRDAIDKAGTLLSNDAGMAANLAWDLQRTDITIYSRQGELEYGLATPAGQGRYVSRDDIAQWISQARQRGSVAVVLRFAGPQDPELLSLPTGESERYVSNKLALLIYHQATAP
jgi:4-amino-4-deoxy-L-arabinose transferase